MHPPKTTSTPCGVEVAGGERDDWFDRRSAAAAASRRSCRTCKPCMVDIGLLHGDLADFRTNREDRESPHEGQDPAGPRFSEVRRISTQTGDQHGQSCKCPFGCHLRAVASPGKMPPTAIDRQILPDAVTDQFTLPGPVFFAASFLLMRPATLAGLQAGYGRLPFSLPERLHFLPVFTSRQSSLNHFVRPPCCLPISKYRLVSYRF